MITRKTNLPVIEVRRETKEFPYNHPERGCRLSEDGYIVVKRDAKTNAIIGCVSMVGEEPAMTNHGTYYGHRFKSFEEASNWVKTNCADTRSKKVKYFISGAYASYTCKSRNKETNKKAIAESWFKEYKFHVKATDEALYIIEPRGGFIDVFFYLYKVEENKITQQITPLKNGDSVPLILRYDMGQNLIGIINEKGEVLQEHLSFVLCENEYSDLRRKVIGKSKLFAPETGKILAEAGFDTVKFNRNWGGSDEVTRINHLDKLLHKTLPYPAEQTAISKEINDFLKDVPFDREHSVVPFKGGYICRFARIAQAWQEIPYGSECRYYDKDGSYRIRYENLLPAEICQVSNYPTYEEFNGGEKFLASKLIEEKMIESYRLFVNSSLSKRTVVQSQYGGERWEPFRIDLADARGWIEESLFSPKNPEHTSLDAESWNKNVWETLYNIHPKLKYLKGYAEKHPSIQGNQDIKFLRAACDYQKIIETFIALKKDDIFWETNSQGNERFVFERFKDLMRLDKIGSHRSDDFYQCLALTKPQFKIIFYNKQGASYDSIMRTFNAVEWHKLVPAVPEDGWRKSDVPSRKCWPKIPADYFEDIIKILTHKNFSKFNPLWKLQRFFDYEFTIKQVLRYVEKGVDVDIYLDYLKMRSEMIRFQQSATRLVGFNPAIWEKKLEDADDVFYSHERLLSIYNRWEEEKRRIRELGEEEAKKQRQCDYDVRYKKIKSLNYKGDDRIIIVPKDLTEIVNEGQVLHHCVGSFCTSVSQGRDTIVFLRHKECPDTPYVTISLLPGGGTGKEWIIDQAHSSRNGDITQEDVDFLKEWGKAKSILEESIQIHYGAKCHH